MTKHKIWIKIVPQIMKELINTLVNCKATFEVNIPKSTIYILDLAAFNYDREGTTSMYRIQINTENNTKDIFIAADNLEEFTVHFN